MRASRSSLTLKRRRLYLSSLRISYTHRPTPVSLDTRFFGRVSSIEGLQFAVNLSELSLVGEDVSDFSPIANLSSLKVLNLSSSGITDLTVLELTSLASLDVSEGVINDLTPLENLTNLSDLNLGLNFITDLTPLEALTNLTSLNLAANPLSEIGALVGNSGSGAGDEVNLAGNPLSDQALETLRARGVIVEL